MAASLHMVGGGWLRVTEPHHLDRGCRLTTAMLLLTSVFLLMSGGLLWQAGGRPMSVGIELALACLLILVACVVRAQRRARLISVASIMLCVTSTMTGVGMVLSIIRYSWFRAIDDAFALRVYADTKAWLMATEAIDSVYLGCAWLSSLLGWVSARCTLPLFHTADAKSCVGMQNPLEAFETCCGSRTSVTPPKRLQSISRNVLESRCKTTTQDVDATAVQVIFDSFGDCDQPNGGGRGGRNVSYSMTSLMELRSHLSGSSFRCPLAPLHLTNTSLRLQGHSFENNHLPIPTRQPTRPPSSYAGMVPLSPTSRDESSTRAIHSPMKIGKPMAFKDPPTLSVSPKFHDVRSTPRKKTLSSRPDATQRTSA